MKNAPRNPTQLDIKIQVAATAWAKLMLWTELAEGEVSAFGTVEELPGILRVTDFFLVAQACNEAETEMDPIALAELMLQVEDPGKLRCWAHSHAEMPVFYSKTDSDCIDDLANGEWLLSIVVNKLHQVLVRLDQFHPAHLYVEDVVFQVYYPIDVELEAQCKAEFKKKVRESKFMTSHYMRSFGELEEAMDWQDWEDEICAT